jgi:hypothetical protein
MLETNNYHFGDVEFGKPYSKSFNITNRTGQVAEIVAVYNGGCTCVEASISKRVLNPNESTKMDVSILPGSMGYFKRSPSFTYKTKDFGPISESLEILANVKGKV